jgi:hypothetical protein
VNISNSDKLLLRDLASIKPPKVGSKTKTRSGIQITIKKVAKDNVQGAVLPIAVYLEFPGDMSEKDFDNWSNFCEGLSKSPAGGGDESGRKPCIYFFPWKA